MFRFLEEIDEFLALQRLRQEKVIGFHRVGVAQVRKKASEAHRDNPFPDFARRAAEHCLGLVDLVHNKGRVHQVHVVASKRKHILLGQETFFQNVDLGSEISK